MSVRVNQIPGRWRAALKRHLSLPVMQKSSGRAHAALCLVSDRTFQRDQRTARRGSVIAAGDPRFLRPLRNLIDLPARGLCRANRRYDLHSGRSGQVSTDSSHLDESQTRLGQNRRRSACLRDYERSRKLTLLCRWSYGGLNRTSSPLVCEPAASSPAMLRQSGRHERRCTFLPRRPPCR